MIPSVLLWLHKNEGKGRYELWKNQQNYCQWRWLLPWYCQWQHVLVEQGRRQQQRRRQWQPLRRRQLGRRLIAVRKQRIRLLVILTQWGFVSWYSMMLWMRQRRALKMRWWKNWVMRLLLMNKMHREILIPVLPSSTVSFLLMWIWFWQMRPQLFRRLKQARTRFRF